MIGWFFFSSVLSSVDILHIEAVEWSDCRTWHILWGQVATSTDDHFLYVTGVFSSQATHVMIFPCSWCRIACGVLMIKAISAVVSTQSDIQTKGEFFIFHISLCIMLQVSPQWNPYQARLLSTHLQTCCKGKTTPSRQGTWLGPVKLD